MTGISADTIGVRYALLINGLLAVIGHIVIGRSWCQDRAPALALKDHPHSG